jgi:putative phosphoesterase
VRAAALYDIHGNVPALDAVLLELDGEGVDVIVVGGDFAAGPMPAEAVDRLRALRIPTRFLRGNAERELAELDWQPEEDLGRRRAAWMREQLGPQRLEFMRDLPPDVTLDVEELGTVFFCHGSPRTDLEILTRETPEARLREAVAGVQADVVVCGHTHSQWTRAVEGITVANAGSVGLPYEERPGAYWALLGPGVEHRRTEYNVEAAAEAYGATGFPDAREYSRETLLEPESPEAAIEFFEQLARERPEFAGRAT